MTEHPIFALSCVEPVERLELSGADPEPSALQRLYKGAAGAGAELIFLSAPLVAGRRHLVAVTPMGHCAALRSRLAGRAASMGADKPMVRRDLCDISVRSRGGAAYAAELCSRALQTSEVEAVDSWIAGNTFHVLVERSLSRQAAQVCYLALDRASAPIKGS